jgi:hypothetical protein
LLSDFSVLFVDYLMTVFNINNKEKKKKNTFIIELIQHNRAQLYTVTHLTVNTKGMDDKSLAL